MSWTRAEWTNGERTVGGVWRWSYNQQRFFIQLDGTDDLGLRRKTLEVFGDEPNFGKFKLIETPISTSGGP